MADEQNREHWGNPEFHHWAQREWKSFITPDGAPDLVYWRPGTELPRYTLTTHLAKPHVRLLQYAIHSTLLPALDGGRRGWDEGAYPQPIPAEVMEQLAVELSLTNVRRLDSGGRLFAG